MFINTMLLITALLNILKQLNLFDIFEIKSILFNKLIHFLIINKRNYLFKTCKIS